MSRFVTIGNNIIFSSLKFDKIRYLCIDSKAEQQKFKIWHPRKLKLMQELEQSNWNKCNDDIPLSKSAPFTAGCQYRFLSSLESLSRVFFLLIISWQYLVKLLLLLLVQAKSVRCPWAPPPLSSDVLFHKNIRITLKRIKNPPFPPYYNIFGRSMGLTFNSFSKVSFPQFNKFLFFGPITSLKAIVPMHPPDLLWFVLFS